MELILMIILVGLILTISWQLHSNKKLKSNLEAISEKLDNILKSSSAEKILMQTSQPTIQSVLIQINRLLAYNQKIIADYSDARESLKKMIANMSHDLKTPLTVILGYVEKLKIDEKLTEEERKQLTVRLYQKTESIINLIHEFFDLVKLESGDVTIPLSKISVSEICRKNLLDFYELFQVKGLQVEVNIPEQNYYILGNEEALNRVLNNLISNAIRYGCDGGVIGLNVRQEGDRIAVEVWDRGQGISEIYQDRVFERLYTLDDARNPAFQGSGLGLTITKRLIESMEGSITLKSHPFEATTFTCFFNKISY